MNAQRYVLGFAFTWDDLIAVAWERAYFSGRRQKVTRDADSWLIVTTRERVPAPAEPVTEPQGERGGDA